jgi:hypothetical protein
VQCILGLPRTGTFSTYTALEILLPGKCHHMARVGTDPTPRHCTALHCMAMAGTNPMSRNVTFWLKAAKGEVRELGWNRASLGLGLICR